MSQVSYHEIPLEDVVLASRLVVLVRPAEPPATTEEIAIEAPPPDPNEPWWTPPDGPIPPYEKITMHYLVQEVLLNETGRPVQPGQAIDVLRSNWRHEFSAHVDYYVRGLSESPVYLSYNGGHDGRETPFIAFLDLERSELRYAFDGATERASAKPAVVEAIRSRPPAVQVTPLRSTARRPGFWARLFGRR